MLDVHPNLLVSSSIQGTQRLLNCILYTIIRSYIDTLIRIKALVEQNFNRSTGGNQIPMMYVLMRIAQDVPRVKTIKTWRYCPFFVFSLVPFVRIATSTCFLGKIFPSEVPQEVYLHSHYFSFRTGFAPVLVVGERLHPPYCPSERRMSSYLPRLQKEI